MLKLKGITKDYVLKGVPTVHALKGIDLNFRRNEFVAILGPSGCGKTTLLNIVGGLDRYTSGDLVIEGKSTKNYNDRDWDTYRNHSIGFVFQSYNLISHQTILSNVELALTISGVKKEERRRRAIEALKTVGLEGMEKKRPNQLSGGQMQRVAIARALINNPEILLADEPTGALDSKTSVQIMDLLKEVAKDRLVIMVTHNPELAEEYATRIVKMQDGLILNDSAPYEDEEHVEEIKDDATVISKGNKKHSSMSFFTAFNLSLANLLSKIKRTVLIAIAGSIGIVGVSSVLAVSFGVNNYIDSMQNDMMSQYPISITETTIDTAALLSGLSSWEKAELVFDKNTQVGADQMLSYMMEKYADLTQVKTNEITPELVRYIENMPEEDVSAVQFKYGNDVTNNIFTTWKAGYEENEVESYVSLNGLTQMYVSELLTVEGFGSYAAFVDLFTNFAKEAVGDEEYISSQYELVGGKGHYPTQSNEMILVVDENQLVTDLLLGQLGFYTQNEFLNIAKKAVEVQKARKELLDEKITQTQYDEKISAIDNKYADRYQQVFDVDQILNKSFKYYPHQIIWEYDENPVFSAVLTLTIPAALTGAEKDTELDLNLLLSYDKQNGTERLGGTLSLNGNSFAKTPIDFTRTGAEGDNFKGQWKGNLVYGETQIPIYLDIADTSFKYTFATPFGMNMMGDFDKDKESLYQPAPGYVYNAKEQADWDKDSAVEMKIVGVLKKRPEISFGSLQSGIYYTKEFTDLMLEDSHKSSLFNDPDHGLKAYIEKGEDNKHAYNAYLTYEYSSFDGTDASFEEEVRVDGVKGIVSAVNGNGLDITSLFGSSNMFSGSSNKTDDAVAALRKLTGIGTKFPTNEDGTTGEPIFLDVPNQIDIYPVDFETKDQVTAYLDKWNEEGDIILPSTSEYAEKVVTYDERKELTYTDTIGMIIAIVDTLILSITIALIAFTGLSLVVSCFMIAVITYISTMERIKEIGVIRSLGGRKKDVSRLFIAETLIIGLASGIIGILVTYGLSAGLNIGVSFLGVFNIAALPIWCAGIMILLSVALNVISGLIPSMKASNQDPVIALRSE